MVENHGRQSFILDLIEIKDDMHENDVPVSDSDRVNLELDSKCDDDEYVVPDAVMECSIVKDASNEENIVTDLNALIPSELDLHKEVIHSLNEKQDEIFVQVSERVSLDEFMVDDKNDSVGSQEPFEVSSLMIDEYNEKHDNLAVISYEDAQQYI